MPLVLPAALGLALMAIGALGFALRRCPAAAVAAIQVMGLGGAVLLLSAARAHGLDGQAVTLVFIALVGVQTAVTSTLIAGRQDDAADGDGAVEEMQW